MRSTAAYIRATGAAEGTKAEIWGILHRLGPERLRRAVNHVPAGTFAGAWKGCKMAAKGDPQTGGSELVLIMQREICEGAKGILDIMRPKEVNWAVISLGGTYTLLKKAAIGALVRSRARSDGRGGGESDL
jgi:hypothetical protein